MKTFRMPVPTYFNGDEISLIFKFTDLSKNEYTVDLIINTKTNIDELGELEIGVKGNLFSWDIRNPELIKVCKKIIELAEKDSGVD